ncbi:unnamed protein product, partial [Ectocarpus sp. 6 AP-2014]
MPVRSITLPAAPPAFSERFPRCGVTTAAERLPSRCVDAASSQQRGRPRDIPTMRSWAALGLVPFVGFGVLRGGPASCFAKCWKQP